MNTPHDGGPAFPWRYMDRDSTGTEVTREQGDGMSLRDWFAGMALMGYLAGRNNFRSENPSNFEAGNACRACYGYADTMIAVRKETLKARKEDA